MRDEIEKVIANLRATFSNPGFVADPILIANKLQAILDADPVSKLEAMGYELWLSVVAPGHDLPDTIQVVLSSAIKGPYDYDPQTPEPITDLSSTVHPLTGTHNAANRLLARIPEAPNDDD